MTGEKTPTAAGKETATVAPRVSFGIELEFVVAYVLDGEADPDEDIKDGIQPLLVVPRAADNTWAPVAPTPWIFDQIRRALADAGLPVYEGSQYTPLKSVQRQHSDKAMSSFNLTGDPSVDEFDIDGYRFQVVELVSPAMYDMSLSFDLIRLAVSTITTRFRCRVNPSCGFHVHVGVGPTERIEARALRNFAALLWAADPLISRLHAPWRSVTKYSQSGRVNEASALGSNEGPSDAILTKLGERNGGTNERNGVINRFAMFRRQDLKRVKYFGRDRRLGESIDPSTDQRALQRELEFDTVDDVAILKGEPWTRRTPLPPIEFPDSSEPLKADVPEKPPKADELELPRINYKPPVPRPQTWDRPYDAKRIVADAPPRPRPPPIERRHPRIPGTMREDRREDPAFLAPYLYRHERGGNLENPAKRIAPLRSDVMSGVRDLLAADMTSAQVGEMMRSNKVTKHINYNFSGYQLVALGSLRSYGEGQGPIPTGSQHNAKGSTVEFREAAGTLDMEWIATWAKICCRLLEWSRDAPPAEFMGVVRLVAYAQEEHGAQYDVIDFLIDLGLYAEARFCEERIHKGDAAFWECLNFEPAEGSSSDPLAGLFANQDDVEMGGMENFFNLGEIQGYEEEDDDDDYLIENGSAGEAGDEEVDEGKSAAGGSGASGDEKKP